jgi:hypothetical protein
MPSRGKRIHAHDNGGGKSPKERSLLPAQRTAAERRWHRDVARQKFRHPPPLGSRFGSIGTFRWPAEDFRPEDVLGSSFEVLDPIRMECSCYIVYEAAITSFQVMGSQNDVMAALARIKKVCFQLAARQVPGYCKYFLHFERDEVVSERVLLAPYQVTEIIRPAGVTARPAEKAPTGDGAATVDMSAVSVKSIETVKKAFFRTIGRLHYYLGPLSLRIRLGTFLATQYMEPDNGFYELDNFLEMIKQSQFEGEFTAECVIARCTCVWNE